MQKAWPGPGRRVSAARAAAALSCFFLYQSITTRPVFGLFCSFYVWQYVNLHQHRHFGRFFPPQSGSGPGLPVIFLSFCGPRRRKEHAFRTGVLVKMCSPARSEAYFVCILYSQQGNPTDILSNMPGFLLFQINKNVHSVIFSSLL